MFQQRNMLPDQGGHIMAHNSKDDAWKLLAEQASKETDPQRLLQLVNELSAALAKAEAPGLEAEQRCQADLDGALDA